MTHWYRKGALARLGNGAMLPRSFLAAALLCFLALGLLPRLGGITEKSLWEDELFVLSMARYFPLTPAPGAPWFEREQVLGIHDGQTFWTAKAAEQSPPLYDLLVKAVVQWELPDTLAVRLPAVLAGCLLLLGVAGLAWRERNASHRVTLIWTTFLIALSPLLTIFSHEGRAYSLGTLLVGMASLVWARRWRMGRTGWQPPGGAELVLYTLACYSHYQSAVLAVLLLSADAWVAVARRSWRDVGRMGLVGVAFAPWVYFNFHAIVYTSKGSIAWSDPSALELLQISSKYLLDAAQRGWVALTLGLAVFLIWQVRRSERPVDGQPLQAVVGPALVSLAYVAAVLGITAKAGMHHPRYFIFVLPLLCFAMGAVLTQVQKPWAVGVLATALFWGAKPSESLTTVTLHTDNRRMAQAVAREIGPDTALLLNLEIHRIFVRSALQAELGYDVNDRIMTIEQTTAQNTNGSPTLCQRLAAHPDVIAFGHASAQSAINTAYAQCATDWPRRKQESFFITFAEHWSR